MINMLSKQVTFVSMRQGPALSYFYVFPFFDIHPGPLQWERGRDTSLSCCITNWCQIYTSFPLRFHWPASQPPGCFSHFPSGTLINWISFCFYLQLNSSSVLLWLCSRSPLVLSTNVINFTFRVKGDYELAQDHNPVSSLAQLAAPHSLIALF